MKFKKIVAGATALTVAAAVMTSIAVVNANSNERVAGFTEIMINDYDYEVYEDVFADVTAVGDTGEYEGFTYTELDDGTLSITGYTGEKTDIVIPAEIYGIKVSEIGDDAFYRNVDITSVVISDGVTRIGNSAFNVAPYSIDTPSLTSIEIPDSVTEIGRYAFGGCLITSIKIPDGVTIINDDTFYRCKSLTEVILPDSVTEIGAYAFSYCSSLKKIKIPDNVTIIGERAFTNCAFVEIDLPANLIEIGDSAFWGCYLLESISIPDGVTAIGEETFAGCSSLVEVNIPEGVTSIGNRAFEKCRSIISVTIPSSVSNIGSWAFRRCDNLTSLVISDGVTTIESGAFSYCSSLTSVTIPKSVTTIDLTGLNSLSEINVDKDNPYYTSVDGVLFNKDKSSLIVYPIGRQDKSYTVPDSVTTIRGEAFSTAYDCDGPKYSWKDNRLEILNIPLDSIVIPVGVTSIADSIFAVQYIDGGAIDGFNHPDNITIYSYTSTAAEEYAKKYDIPFIALPVSLEDKDNEIKIEGTLPYDTVLTAEKATETEDSITYDITLKDSEKNEIHQLDTEVTVKIPAPSDWESDKIKVYRAETNGNYTDMKAEYSEGYMVFTTDHFSTYVITTQLLGENNTGTPTTPGGSTLTTTTTTTTTTQSATEPTATTTAPSSSTTIPAATTANEDASPNTGVTLLLLPIITAAAGVIISKKRK